MSVGTKVSLVVGVLFAAVLAFYYGLGSPVKNDLDTVSQKQASETLKQVAATGTSRTKQPATILDTNLPTFVDSTKQRRGLLSESVQRALGSSKPVNEAKITQRNQFRAGGLVPKNVQNNLTKDSGQDLNPVKTEPQAIDPLASKVVKKTRTSSIATARSNNRSSSPRSTLQRKPNTTPYTVKKNDSMWTIAKAWYGNGSKWNLIAKANPYVDPDRLKLGQVLQLPPKNAGPRPKPTRITRDDPNTYRVQDGDSLSSIADKYYGDETKWRIIYEANRAVIGNDPGALELGAKLVIPPKSS